MTNNTATESAVLSREVLHSGAIIAIQLPKTMKPGKLTLEDGTVIDYMQFPFMLPGGMVNACAMSSDMTLARTTVRARVEIMVKTMISGERKFAYINLHLVDKAEQPTRKLFVLRNEFERQPHWEIFETPGMDGFIALAAPGDKAEPPEIVIQETVKPIVASQRRAPKPLSAAQPIEGNRPFADALAALKL